MVPLVVPLDHIAGALFSTLLAAGASASPLPSPAQAPPAQSAPPPCRAPEHRQFDFWLGDWNVTDPQGKLVGTNKIESVLGGCVLHESWTGTGMSGNSYNIYFAGEKRWHQTWVDNRGTLLELNGAFQDGQMVLAGEGPGPQGGRVKHRITWSKLDRGRVRQVWESSTDGGVSWTVAFDGTYAPRV
ncbi:MAG TPA: hypothetical protein VI589_08165 [Vicinamibacteria bacterium]